MADYRKIYAIKAKNELKILEVCPDCPNRSGIYFLIREENGFKFAYIGQALKLRERLASHLSGYQRIDLSLKKHGFWSEENPAGYKLHFLEFSANELDDREKYFIKKYANTGYQMRNETIGGQGKGKAGLDNARPNRGYHDGLIQGEKKSREYVRNMFEKYLSYDTQKKPPNKLQERKIKEFEEWMKNENQT